MVTVSSWSLNRRSSLAISCSGFVFEGIGCRAMHASRPCNPVVSSVMLSAVDRLAIAVPRTVSSMVRVYLEPLLVQPRMPLLA